MREPANLAFQSVTLPVCVLVFVSVPLFLTAPLREAQRLTTPRAVVILLLQHLHFYLVASDLLLIIPPFFFFC